MALVAVSACGHAVVPDGTVAAGGAEVDAAREPDGVFLDQATAEPLPRDIATARGVVALLRPISHDEIQTLVRAYFRAFVAGDPSAFAPLLAHNARRLEDGGNPELATSLERRLHTVDYTHLSFELLAAYDEMRVTPFDAAPESLRGLDAMRDGDVLVEVPVRVEQIGIVRIFGPKVVFVLRRAEGHGAWQIAGVRENDGPWT